MQVAITGSSGLVGAALGGDLRRDGHTVVRLVRRREGLKPDERSWRPDEKLPPEALADCDAVVHLAGENIAGGRWTEELKARIRDSRVLGTQTICAALADVSRRPLVLVCASATGYYGDRGDEVLDEQAAPGEGFLPEVCQAWEAATKTAADAGVRVVNLRISMALSPDGGALAKMLTPFKLGVGGVLGSGRQYMSWIDLDDLVAAIRFALTADGLAGPVNAAAPNPVTNKVFTKTLGSVLHRPTVIPVPAVAARAAFGEMADALLLASTRAVPRRLREAGFAFRYPDLESALRHQLKG